MTKEPGSRIAQQDEILELLYWLEGEGFKGNATLAGLARFLTHPENEVRDTLAVLIQRGDVEFDDAEGGQYRLTDVGCGEAARRFAESFAPLLSQGHGECNDPDCECHKNPASAAECHAARAGGAHAH